MHRLPVHVAAETIGEIRLRAFVTPTAAMRAELIAASATDGLISFSAPSQANPNTIDFSATGNQDGWAVYDEIAL